MAIAIWTTPRPRKVTTAMANSRPGMASMMSTTRMITESTQPRKKPARAPSMVPTAIPIDTDMTAIPSVSARAEDDARQHVLALHVRSRTSAPGRAAGSCSARLPRVGS